MGIILTCIRRYLFWFFLIFYWLLACFLTHLRKFPQSVQFKIFGKDTALHFLGFAMLCLLYWLARYRRLRPGIRQRQLWVTILIMGIYAALDELTQIPFGRQCDIMDWFSDMAGAVTGLVLLYWLRSVRSWMVLYWGGLLILTHWPGEGFLVLPKVLKQFESAYLFAGYVGLTLLFWRSLCPEDRFQYSRDILLTTLIVICGYALLDETLSLWLKQGFEADDFLVGCAGALFGSLCSILLAQQPARKP